MDRKIEIIPGIFEKNIDRIQKRIFLVSPYVDWVQIDLADGKLVPNLSYHEPSGFREIIKDSSLKFELHMMVEHPINMVNQLINAGFKRLIIHYEGMIQETNWELRITNLFKEMHQRNVEVGLAIDKQTSADVLFPFLNYIDCVLVMTIAAGFSGQTFIPELLEKVTILHQRKPLLPIEVDGGINFETAQVAVHAGATRLVSTSTIFNSENIKETIEHLQKI